jgi:hypothetical protein
LWLVGLAAAAFGPMAGVAQTPTPLFAQRSVSRSRQFIVYCPDVALRVAVTGYVETLKASLLETLGLGDHWKLPIVVNLKRPTTEELGRELTRVRLFNTEEGSKVQIDVALREDQFQEVRFPQQVIRALLLEMAYRGRPPADGEPLAEPPSWLVEGLAERFEVRATDSSRDAAVFQQLIDTGRLPKLRDFLASEVETMDTPSRMVYASSAACLLEMLEGLPGGRQGLAYLARSFAQEPGDATALLLRHFPSLDAGSLEKWWTLGLARASARERYLGLSVEETNAQLLLLLKMEVVTDEKKGAKTTFAIGDFKAYLKYRTARPALMQQEGRLAALQTKAHPLLRPVVLEYQRIVAELARGNSRRAERALREVDQYRAMVVERMDRIVDTLNWYEATQMPERSGAFDRYLKAAAALEKAAPPRRDDAITRYIDQVERQFD